MRKHLGGSRGTVEFDDEGARCLRPRCGRRWNGLAQCDCNLQQPSTKRSRRREPSSPFEPSSVAVEALRARGQRIAGAGEGVHPVVGLLTGEVTSGVFSPGLADAISPARPVHRQAESPAEASPISPTLSFQRKDSPWRRGDDAPISPTLPFERKDTQSPGKKSPAEKRSPSRR